MSLSDTERDAALKRLHVINLWLAVIDGRRMLATMLGPAESEADAMAAVTAALSCDAADADQVLGLQLRRFTELARSRLSDERQQWLIDLARSEEKHVPPATVSIPASRRLYVRFTEPVDSRPLSDDQRTDRHRRYEDNRTRSLAALAQAAKDWTTVVELVHDSTDESAARESLASRFRWSRSQAVTVLDMQVRMLSAWSRRQIEAELDCVR